MKNKNRKLFFLLIILVTVSNNCTPVLIRSDSEILDSSRVKALDSTLDRGREEGINKRESEEVLSNIEESTPPIVPPNKDSDVSSEKPPEIKPQHEEKLITGNWGTCPYTFDTSTGKLILDSGNLGTKDESPWYLGTIDIDEVLEIELKGTIIFPEDSASLFSDSRNLQGHGLRNLKKFEITGKVDTSQMKGIATMFHNARSLENLDLSQFDTSSVTNMIHVFAGMTSLKNLNISSWDTRNAISKGVMFGEVNSLQRLVLGDNIRLTGDVVLQPPNFSNGRRGDKWTKEDGTSAAYFPKDFEQSYGTGDLTAGTYVSAKKYTLRANNFSMYIGEINLGNPQSFEKLIKERASLVGQDYETDGDVTENITIVSNDIQPVKGTYEVTFGLYDQVKTIVVNVMDDIEAIDVQLPLSTEFAVLDVDDGKIISPLYKIINNSDKGVFVNISRITVTSNNSGIQLLKGSDPDPTEIRNAIKVRLDYSDFDEQTSIDAVNSDKPRHLLELNPLEHGIFSISGKYFGDYKDKKELKLTIEYAFQAVL